MIQSPAQPQVVYQADPQAMKMVHSIQAKVNQLGRQLQGRRVRVQTADGHVFEGTIVNVDGNFLYLSVSQSQLPGHHRAWLGSAAAYNNVVLPLVLYNLLVITLLYT